MVVTAFIAELRRSMIEFKRYPTEFLSQVFLVVLIFYGIFLGGTYITGGEIMADRLSIVIISYMMWLLVLEAIGSMGYTISEEAKNGNLEQIFLSPLGATTVLFVRNLANLLYNLVFIGVSLFAIIYLTGHRLDLAFINLIPLLMGIGAAMGLGYFIASMTIIFKRTTQFLSMLQFVLLFIMMTPFALMESGAWVSIFIPLAPMTGLLHEMIVFGKSLSETPTLFLWSCLNLVIWLGAGIIVFNVADTTARKMGTLGHY